MTTTTKIFRRAAIGESADPTIVLPTEVHVTPAGIWVACHADSGDAIFVSQTQLEAAYQITLDLSQVSEVSR